MNVSLRAALIGLGAGVFLAPVVFTQSPTPKAAPVVGTSLRYCNPLPIETSSRDGSPQGVNLGDVTVVRERGKYYLFGTGGGGGCPKTWSTGGTRAWRCARDGCPLRRMS